MSCSGRGAAILASEVLRAPRTTSEPADSVVAGEGFEPPTSGHENGPGVGGFRFVVGVLRS